MQGWQVWGLCIYSAWQRHHKQSSLAQDIFQRVLRPMKMSALISLLRLSSAMVLLGLSIAAPAETCSDVRDMDPATRGSLENAALQMFGSLSRGDAATLRQSAIPSLASNFSGVESAINANKSMLTSSQASVRATYLLEAGGTANL